MERQQRYCVSPAGSDGQIQYNNGGALGGASQLYFDDSTARLGVGTSSPGAEIEISNDSPTLRFTDTDTDLTDNEIAAAIEFYGSDTDDPGLAAYIHADADGTGGAMQLRFGTGTAGVAADRMTIQADGKVGIGNTSPSEMLDVNGNINIAGSDGAIIFGAAGEDGPHGLEVSPSGTLESALYYRTGPNSWSFEDASGNKIAEFDSDDLLTTFGGNVTSAHHFTAQSGGADGGIVLGQAFSSSYVGLRTANMSESSLSEYNLITDGTHTFISAATDGDVYIRGGGNDSSCQILLDTSEDNVAITGTLSVSGIVTLSDEIKGGSGSAADPTFTFASDGDTGLYPHAANELGVSAGGTQIARFASNGIRVANGSAATPAYTFINDSNTGFFITGNGGVTRWSGNGTEGGYLYSGGVRIVNGSAALPSYSFSGDSDTGMYRNTTNQLSLTAGGTQSLIAAAGTVNTAGLSTSTTSGYRYVMRNNTFGTLYHFTSSADVKENITNVSSVDSGAWIDALQPVTFIEKWLQDGVESEEDRAFREADVQVGFIADDVLADPTTSQFAQVEDVDGTLKGVGWKWECVIAAAVAEIKSLRARVAELESS